jgi:RnfABCDGE-type electron transport complex G subunit
VKQLSLIIPALICGILVSSLYAMTKNRIDSNRTEYALQQIREVIDNPDARLRKLDKDTYAVEDETGGTVFKHFIDAGYNGPIVLWVGLGDNGVIRGVRVLEHRETPGIGDVIDRHVSDWIDRFTGRSLQTTPSTPDAVSGATITTTAVTDAVHRVLEDHRVSD